MPRSDRRMASTARLLPIALLATAASLTLPGPKAHAGITNYNIFGNLEYTQTGNGVPTGTPLAFFSSQIISNNSTDVTAATGSSGTSSTYNFTTTGNTSLYQTGFITQAELNADLTGKANFNITGGTLAGQSASVFLPSSPLFSPFVPYLIFGAGSLQGLNTFGNQSIAFNSFVTVAGATEQDIFITITNTSDNSVAYSTKLARTATSFNLPANTLAANTSYNLEIDFSSRLNGSNSGVFNGATLTEGYDTRTEIGFTTGPLILVPEPSSLALTTFGAASAALVLARRRRKAAPLV